jgi:protoporphyrinogen oxidase
MFRDVVIIGGGLTGLSAAYTLDQTGLACTLIEVKPRLGGSLGSEYSDGFILDTGPMLFPDSINAPFLRELGLADDVFTVETGTDDDQESMLGFQHGAQSLIDALARPLLAEDSAHSLMMRMAVSTLGWLELDASRTRFGICMENGMLLDARAVIVTAPARYAERIFYTLKPEISVRLLDYRYDSIARLSLGYRAEDAQHIPSVAALDDYPISYVHAVNHPARVPAASEDGDYRLMQVGVRYDPYKGIPQDVVGQVTALMGWSQSPLVERVTQWSEADPLMWLDDEHPERMEELQHLLPEGIALAGSDYLPTGRPTLQDRFAAGQAAAQKVMAYLGKLS